MLGEHGYVGLLLFVGLGVVGWMNSRRIIRYARNKPEYVWAADLARAVQVSLIGFAAGGMFVNIAYWELQYCEVIALMLAWAIISKPLPIESLSATPAVASRVAVRA
jgi:putative inorganic carbon (HCO3(-)) transporter